jgi:hypothetical protein
VCINNNNQFIFIFHLLFIFLQIRNSFDGNQCDAEDVRVYGFKSTLFAGGMLSDRNKQGKWDRFKEELHDGKVRIIRLKRTNRLEQALTVYWKSVKQLGNKGFKGGVIDRQRKVEDYSKLDSILQNIDKREELLDNIVKYVNAPTLTLTYEELKLYHKNAIRKLSTFLAVKLSGVHDENAALNALDPWYRDESRALCESVENYAAFCMYYSKTIYAEHLKDPCAPGVWDCCKCKPMPRMTFPNPSLLKR